MIDDPPPEERESGILNFKKRCLCYIAGYVCRRLVVKCGTCYSAILDSKEDPLDPKFSRLIRLKDRTGALKTPSKSVFDIILRCESIFENIIKLNKLPSTENIMNHFAMKVLRTVDINCLFPSLSNHLLEQNPLAEEVQNIYLVKLIAHRYFKVRCLSYTKVLNQSLLKVPSTRNQCRKNIQFKHL